MARMIGPMEGTNWTAWTCICSHWLCGPLVCHWPLCGRHGSSWAVPRGNFATSHPTHPSPPHPTSSTPFHPTPSTPFHPIPPHCLSHLPPLFSILMTERDDKNYFEIQPSEIEKVSYNKKQCILLFNT